MANVRVSHERPRGCGYRKGGGLYLVLGEFQGHQCGKLPVPLEKCPTCGAGIKFARGWTWINGKSLFATRECWMNDRATKLMCVLEDPPEQMGLIWIGEKYYKTANDWINEGREMGVSRRIKSIPKGFKIGETWVCVAHIEGIPAPGGGDNFCEKTPNNIHEFNTKDVCKHCKKRRVKGTPAIFQVFRPTAIEYIVKGDETEEELEKLEERGISLVKVVKIGEKKDEKQEDLGLSTQPTA